MFLIGNHVSSSKGYLAMGKQAAKLGGNTFAFFTRNPRGGAQKPPHCLPGVFMGEIF